MNNQQAPIAFDRLRSTQLYRPGVDNPDFSYSSGQWTTPIDRLLAARYSFLPFRYSNNGYLFRGMQTGAGNSITNNTFGYFAGDDELCLVEQSMNVFFLTQDISDAITVSRLFECPDDGCIIAIRAKFFNDCLENHSAAVLGIGDGGMVFRYPFITSFLVTNQIDYIFLSEKFRMENSLLPRLAEKIKCVTGNTRKELETCLGNEFRRLGIRPASPVPSTRYPRLIL